jgi:type IV secretion system protein VirD4
MSKIVKWNIFLFLVVMASWVATEILAWDAQCSPVLGKPLYSYHAMKIYHPFAAWEWAWKWAWVSRKSFERAGFVFLAITTLTAVGLFLRPTPKIVARWATRRDLREYNLLGNVGIVLGKWGKTWLRYFGDMHVLIVAPSGSGKSRSVAVPTCLTWKDCLFVHDPKIELYKLTAGWRSNFSSIYYLNPTDPDTDHINPWEEVRVGTSHEIRDLSLITEILVDPDGEPNVGHENMHFRETATDFLNGIGIHGLYTGKATNLSELATLFMMDIPVLVNEMDTHDHHQYFPHMPDEVFTASGTHQAVKWAVSILKRVGDRELGSICSTAGRALRLAFDYNVAQMMSYSDFSLKEIRQQKKPVTVYFTIPYSDQKRLRIISRIIIQQVIDYNTQELDTWKWRMLQINDEVQSFGRMPIIPNALGYVRGYGYNMCNITPSLNQLDHYYGENNNFIENSHIQVVYAPNDQKIAKRFSGRTGELDIEKSRESYSGDFGKLFGRQSTSTSKEKEALFNPSEVLFMNKNDGLLIVGNGGFPAKIKKSPDYRDKKLRKRSQIPPAAPTCP